MAKTLLDKIWDRHVITDLGNGFVLLHIDRLLLHDLSGARALQEAVAKGYAPAQPRLVYATPDHAVSTAPGRTEKTFPPGEPLVRNMRVATQRFGIRLFDLGQDGNGIVHIIGPELALTLPGTTLICGDSHTCTHGGMGALAFGVGSSELVHALATQTMVQRKPRRLRVRFEGAIPPGVTPKDMILHLIGDLGTAAGTGHAVEYAGSAIRALPVEGRLTICNLSIEMGARTGMVAPDDVTFEYLHGRDFAPKDALWDRAVAHWRTLPSDPDAEFDREHTIDMARVAPQITWGTSPEHVIAVDRAGARSRRRAEDKRAAWTAALQYQGPHAGQPIEGTKVDWVFIGSCTNSRISDLRAAAAIAKGRHKASHVTAWVVPGSERVKREAEAEGLDRIFSEAGFEWREPAARCASRPTASACRRGSAAYRPPTAISSAARAPARAPISPARQWPQAAAITGAIADVRKF
jgi:3-isopropylmalate/(R)-2-methylmalate dehydratase large subunit